MKLLFVETPSNKKILPVARKALEELEKYTSIGLVTTVQFIRQLDEVKRLFESHGKEVFLAEGMHCVYPGQVLGCDVEAAIKNESRVECFLYIGTGEFHSLGIATKTEKPVFKADPFTEKITKISEDERKTWLKKQAARVSKFNDAKKVGILVSTKPGQYKDATQLKNKIEAKGKDAYIFLTETINPQELENFPDIDIWVNTACPRLVDDQELFKKPVINSSEIK